LKLAVEFFDLNQKKSPMANLATKGAEYKERPKVDLKLVFDKQIN
tara:strand:+ start:220 stop:354 length:135 start_codon:yes stop_codon:yes gene_type:complete